MDVQTQCTVVCNIGNDPAISDSVQNQILECWRRSEPIGTQKPANIHMS